MQLFSVEKLITFFLVPSCQLPAIKARLLFLVSCAYFFCGGKNEAQKENERGEKTHFPIWINFIPIYQDILATV